MNIAPYGTWRSPLGADVIVSDAVRLGDVAADDGRVWWVEGRPTEGGRQVLVCRVGDERPVDVLPAPYSVRTRAHEYGGGAVVVAGPVAWFCNDADQRIYRVALGANPEAVTPVGPWRFADAVFDAARNRLVCVREDHTDETREPRNELVSVSLADGEITVLASGRDFYASPRLRPQGDALVFLTWDHPQMPWDGTQLWLAELEDGGALATLECVAGSINESVTQPMWSPDGYLHWISDTTGWWNLYRQSSDQAKPQALYPAACDFGKPHWQFGTRTYGFIDADRLVCGHAEEGSWGLGVLNVKDGQLTPLALPFTDFDAVNVDGGRVACIAGAPDAPSAVAVIDLATERTTVLRESSGFGFDDGYLSRPESIWFPSGGMDVHAFFYAPANAAFRAGDDERPPLIVIGHGGPTGATSAVLNTRVQYWTSRGFAVVDVNYRGSTGFGRTYRDALKGAWGVADVEDCVNAALYLGEQGRVDPQRMAIRGGSAGGFTALAALVFHSTFKAGASHYGISELEVLAKDTHKFEARYLDSLIGPYPDARDVYVARSPIHHADGLDCPVIFFQGLEDRVVPPNQAEMMVDKLKAKGLPVAYLAFEGEQHGFRKAETIMRTLEAELYFYGRVFGFTPAGDIPPVEIFNLVD